MIIPEPDAVAVDVEGPPKKLENGEELVTL